MDNWNQNQSGWYNAGNWNPVDGGGGGGGGYEIPEETTIITGNGGGGGADFSNFYGGGGNQKQQQRGQQLPSASYGGNVFYPNTFIGGGGGNGGFVDDGGVTGGGGGADFENEPPLLEELGVNFDHIRQKTLAVLNPLKVTNPDVIHDSDLAGPLVFCLVFGASLLLHGKVHFGSIYGIGVLGCLGVYLLLNLMSVDGISITCTVSVIGYCLLPMALLSLIAAAFSFKGLIGLSIAIAAVLWCSLSASKLFVTALSMDSQRWLVAYPCSLLYGLFALLTIF